MIEHVDAVPLDLPLCRAFRIARGSTETARSLILRVRTDEHTAWGCAHASPDVTGETLKQARAALDALEPNDLDARDVPGTLDRLDAGPAARAAVDLALHDLAGKRAGTPAHRLVGLPDGEIASAATVTVASVDEAVDQARAWTGRGYLLLKVKIDEGSPVLELVDALNEALPETVREPLPTPGLLIDANEALTLDEALELAPHLAERNVRLLEQPLPRGHEDELAQLAEQSPVPVVADESVQSPEDVQRFARSGAPVGVNVKVQKVGGLLAATRCLKQAREAGLTTMVGCNLETGLGIAAGACLSGTVDHADLDGNLFLEQDPFPLPRPLPGHAGTPEGPGLGVSPDPRFPALKA